MGEEIGKWERLRALGAVAGDPADARAAAATLDLPDCGDAEHTEVFAFNCPPYASVYLGEGGSDRLAGFWRALGLDVPAEPDHLTTLLSLYACLGEAAAQAHQPATAAALGETRQALFAEHLWPWLPGYLGAVSELRAAALMPWAELTLGAIKRERGRNRALPLALRDAPPPADADGGLDELLDVLVAPIRSGLILTRRAVADGAAQIGAGHRIGNRRAALRAILESEPDRSAKWLAEEAARWSRRHLAVAFGDPAQQWWADRATATARMLGSQCG